MTNSFSAIATFLILTFHLQGWLDSYFSQLRQGKSPNPLQSLQIREHESCC